MSDIPLRNFRRTRQSRTGYTALPEDEHTSADSQTDRDMPLAARAAATRRCQIPRIQGAPVMPGNRLGNHHRGGHARLEVKYCSGVSKDRYEVRIEGLRLIRPARMIVSGFVP